MKLRSMRRWGKEKILDCFWYIYKAHVLYHYSNGSLGIYFYKCSEVQVKKETHQYSFN